MNRDEEIREWLAGRPDVIRRLVAEYPPGTPLRALDGSVAYVIGYCEDGGITMTTTAPGTDYEKAMSERFYVCPACLACEPDPFREFNHGANGCPQP